MTADVVTCDLCGKDWPENSDGIWWQVGEARCTDIRACLARVQEAANR